MNKPTIDQLKQELAEMDEATRNRHLEFLELMKETGRLYCENKLSDEQIDEFNLLIADARSRGSHRYLPLDPDYELQKIRGMEHFVRQAKKLAASSIEDGREPSDEEIHQVMRAILENTKEYCDKHAETIKSRNLN